MKPFHNPFDDVNMIAQLADLKEIDYKNTLLLTAMMDLLVEKGILSRREILDKARELEEDLTVDMPMEIN